MLMQQLDYNLLFRWFVGMDVDGRVWNHADDSGRCSDDFRICRLRAYRLNIAGISMVGCQVLPPSMERGISPT